VNQLDVTDAVAEAEAEDDLYAIWQPNQTWRRVIQNVKDAKEPIRIKAH
jgi:hypothetical protein